MSGDFLSRWSRLKRRSTAGPERPTADAVPAKAGTPLEAAVAGDASAPGLRRGDEPVETSEPLPPIESLTPDSDFLPFMKPEVDGVLKRQALRTLFRDPRFNVMDGLDVYIDDYSKADPLPEGWLEKMTQTARLGEYKAPEEEVPKPGVDIPDAVPEVLPQAADVVQKEPPNEALATPEEAASSDTLEALAMPPPVPESPLRG